MSPQTKNRLIALAVIVIISTQVSTIYGQPDLPDGGNVLDAPAAPIDAFIAIALAVGSYFGVKKLRK